MQFRFYASSPSAFAPQLQPKIDRQNLLIRGVTAMQSGVEALGHGCMTDDKTLQMMLELTNDNKPRRQRFGHPGVSENATGKQVAQASNFSIKDGNLIHDSRLLESARKSPAFAQDPIEYILHIAENNPTEFGESVVIDADVVWTLTDGRDVPQYQRPKDEEDRRRNATFIDVDGVERHSHNYKPVNALTALPVLRPVEFYYVDYVGEGALTHEGMFPASMQRLFSTGVNAYAEELFNLVDNWRNEYGIELEQLPKKLDQLLNAYMQRRTNEEINMKRRFTNHVAESAQKFEDENELEQSETLQSEADDGQGDELDQAEQVAAQIIAGTVEEFENAGLLAEMSDRMDQFEDVLERMTQKFDRMLSLLNTNLEATAAMQRNVARLSGDPVVTQRVPKQAQPQMDALPAMPQFEHPNGVNGMMFSKKPTSVASRINGGALPADELEPAQAAILRRAQRRAETTNSGMFSNGLADNQFIGG